MHTALFRALVALLVLTVSSVSALAANAASATATASADAAKAAAVAAQAAAEQAAKAAATAAQIAAVEAAKAAATAAEAAKTAAIAAEVNATAAARITPDPTALVDFAVPENAAAAILNSSIAATKPTTPRDLAAGLSSMVDKDGNIKPGVSIAFVPYLLLRGEISEAKYQNATEKFLSRAQISAATAAVSTDDSSKGALAAVGLNLVFIDRADPRESKEADKIFAKFFPSAPDMPSNPDNGVGASYEVLNNQASREFASALQQYRKSNWNARSLGAGFALRRLSTSGALRNTKDDGWGGWLTYADRVPGGGIFQNSLFLFNMQYRAREKVDNAGTPEQRDTFRSGIQVRVGSSDLNGYAEAFYRRVSTKGAGRKSDWSAEAGLEYRVHDGTWLNVSWVDDVNGTGESGVKTGMRFGIGKGPKWKMDAP